MFIQFAIGSVLFLMSILIAGGSFLAMEWAFFKRRHWLAREPHRPKLILVLMVSTVLEGFVWGTAALLGLGFVLAGNILVLRSGRARA